MQKDKTMAKNVKNIEKIFQLMKKYHVSVVELDGLKITKNYHEFPQAKNKSPETNGKEQEQFLWPSQM